MVTPPIRRGEIWWAELPAPHGAEPGYRRPVLVLQSDHFNASRLATVVAASITGNLRLAEVPGNVRLSPRDGGLPKPSVVNLTQIGTIDREDLTERVGAVPPSVMRAVEEGLRLVLDLPGPGTA